MRRLLTLARWWSLYLIFPVACILLWLEHQAPVPPIWHGILLMVSVGVIYGLLALWCGSNTRELDRSQTPARHPQLIEPKSSYAGKPGHQAVPALPQPHPVQRRRYQLALLPVAVIIASRLSHGHQLAERHETHEQ